MAVIALIDQHVTFISAVSPLTSGGPVVIDDVGLLNDPIIQDFASNSQTGTLLITRGHRNFWNGSTYAISSFIDLRGFISAAYQTTLQGNMATLQANWSSGYVVKAWGSSANYGW